MLSITIPTLTYIADASSGALPAGTAMAKVTATGKYVAYDDDGTDDGRRTMVGLLLVAVDATGANDQDGVIVIDNAIVDESKLPTGNGVDAAGKVEVGAHFTWI